MRGSGTNGTANYGGVTGHTPAGGSLGAKGGQKTAKNGLTATAAPAHTGNSGSVSDPGTHTHSLTSVAAEYYSGADAPLGGPYAVRTSGGSVSGTQGGGAHSHTVAITHTHAATSAVFSSTDTETAPASLAMNYIIKI